jgi:hypothetical protein
MRLAAVLAGGGCVAALVLAAGGSSVAAPTDGGAADAAADAPVPACVKVSTNARNTGLGFNHIVTLANGCEKKAVCTVATDVNPTRQTAEIPPGATTEVMTFLESPASTFVAKVACVLR